MAFFQIFFILKKYWIMFVQKTIQRKDIKWYAKKKTSKLVWEIAEFFLNGK